MISKHCAAALAAMVTLAVNAEETSVEHEAHEHGIATLDVALEEGSLQLEFTSPAVNIVGFEHHPEDDAQTAAVSDAVATLERANEVFGIPDDAGCELVSASVETELEHEEEHHGEEGHEDEDPAHADSEQMHSEFHSSYHYECAEATKLNTVKVRLFELYPGIEEIHARVIGPSGQTAQDLTAAEPDLPL